MLRSPLPNLATALLLAVCSQALAEAVAVEDATGATIALAAPARRIVSLAPEPVGLGDRWKKVS